MGALEKMGVCGIVPVVVLDELKNALSAAGALLAGGVDVMEITLRTKAGLDAIREVAGSGMGILVGVGTVISLEQCKTAVEAGAQFVVTPGFDRSVVEWCVDKGVPVTPGCVTPTEITMALTYGIKILKFFPANIYGGLSAMKALSGPFGDVKYIPTGGVGAENIREYIAAPYVHAVGGSWICTAQDIKEGNFAKITSLCNEARIAIREARGVI